MTLKIVVPAFLLTKEILAHWSKNFGVECTNRDQEPWAVEFVGSETGLRTILAEDWEYEPEAIDEIINRGEPA